MRYIGSSWADTANTLEVPAVVLGDLALHYEWQNWRTALNVINLTDKIYVRELCLGHVVLLRRSPARDRQRLLQVVRAGERTAC
ncbi:hypothetical protein BRDID11002_67240 [Bradyrhizobium diazoefficiens]